MHIVLRRSFVILKGFYDLKQIYEIHVKKNPLSRKNLGIGQKLPNIRCIGRYPTEGKTSAVTC